ncbi:flavodoxin domain-containing protein [Ornithinibacillus halotolerans]|uniref:Flavodoxin n=1 Tax=Ornithinibacillus halotolerans TaxID=1274357 RepID=A0A916W584_9BACI|nr:flavodoxin domain-containing protein [Ornithinibacillus halotolerans]GGA66714.1 flavodoxin [Ornithinibacillus halotolerans]
MSNFLVLYASASGNTEIMAEVMATYLKKLQHQVTMKNFDFDQITIEELNDYDATLIGVYTYDFGEIPFEVEFFYDELDMSDISGSICGVFGAGDSAYGDTFGMAVDLMYEKLEECGAQLHPTRLKVDLTPEKEDIENCEVLAEGIAQLVEEKAVKALR